MALRSLLKNYIFSLINILGLAVGIAACLLILQYVEYETGYDRFHKHAENIYRVRAELYEGGTLTNAWATGCAGIAPAMKEKFPEVLDYARLVFREGMVSFRDTRFREDRLLFAEPSFIKIFSFPVVRGDALKALSEPNTALVSETYARKYFGSEDPMDKTIKVYVDGIHDFMIKGIFKDIPANSHIDFDVMLSYQTLINTIEGQQADSTLIGLHYYIYVLFASNVDLEGFDAKLNALYVQLVGGMTQLLGTFKNTVIQLHLQPLTGIHLHSNYLVEIKRNGSAANVNFLLIMALFILLAACVNYIILTAAKALERFKEVGIRQVLGATRVQLLKQFLLESLLPALISVMTALLFIGLSIPFFQRLSGMPLTLSLFKEPVFWLHLAAIFLFIFVLSVIFPAFILPAIGPTASLRGRVNSFFGKIFLRKGLVVFQFVVALILIAGTIVIFQQLAFMKNRDLGFDIRDTLVIRGPRAMEKNKYTGTFSAFKEKLLDYPGILSICRSNNIPGMKIFSSAKVLHSLVDDKDSSFIYGVFCDYDYLPAYKVKLLVGRYFSRDHDDVRNVVLTEKAARSLGFTDLKSAIGKELLYFGGPFWMKVVGVTENYCQTSLKREQDPILFICLPGIRNFISVKINTTDILPVMSQVKENWQRFFPGEPFDYFFLDDFFTRQYDNETRFGQIFLLFSILSILLSCLGILGLSLSTLLRKTKEVGIRKAIGANVTDILSFLYKDYLKLMAAANIIAFPIIYFVMGGWLRNFAYRVRLGWLPFGAAALVVCIVALATVSYHVVKMANSNPVVSLRYE